MKTTYLPNMSDHAASIAAAFNAFGLPAEPLPPSDQKTLSTALELCRGRECLPCFMTTGDIVKKCRESGFKADQARFFMSTGHGPCRMGQYVTLQREILDRLGFGDVEILGANETEAYQFNGLASGDLRKLIWQGLCATDLLLKLRHEYRPYETEPGRADTAYTRSFAHVNVGTLARGGKALVEAMKRSAREFEAVTADRSQPRPLIALVGELYVSQDAFSNNGLIREVEREGGEVLLTTFTDWLYYCDFRRRELAWQTHAFKEVLVSWIQEAVERRWEHKLHAPIAHLLRHAPEEHVSKALPRLDDHYDTLLGGEGVMTMARSASYASRGVAGILNILPFSCMLGTIASGMAPRLRRDVMDMVPWLDVPFDGQEITNVRTRLGAFMHQARQFQASRERRRSA